MDSAIAQHLMPAGFSDGFRVFLQASGRLEAPGHAQASATAWTHAFVAAEAPMPARLDARVDTVLHVAERILGRGRCPPVERSLARALRGLPEPPASHSDASMMAWQSPDGSAEEGLFLARIAPELLGQSLLPYLHLQVPMATLLGSEGGGGLARVDFAVLHPGAAGNALVIEIDGAQHDTPRARQDDDRRVELLRRAGHAVFRIPVDEVRNGGGPSLDALSLEVGRLPDVPAHDRLAVAAAQTAATLILLIRSGVLSPAASQWTLVTNGPCADAVTAGARSTLRLLGALESLYGTQVCPAEMTFVQTGSPADAELYWTDAEPWQATVSLFSDGGVPRVTIRPTWLPGLAPPSLPPAEWVAPAPAPTSADLAALLQFVFPDKEAFWPGQEDALRRCLEGLDSLVLLPTGAGKSLIYQLAAVLLPGMTVIVAPLVSLMEDQIDNLQRSGYHRALTITSATTAKGETQALLAALRSGAYHVCYVSPERLQIQAFRDVLAAVRVQMPIPLIVIDEAHCVSEWGHDFRPAYLNVGRLSRRIGRRSDRQEPAVVGLTGTASRAVLRDVQRELDILDLDAVITPETFDRPELTFEVHRVTSRQKAEALVGALRAMPGRLGRLPHDFFALRERDTASGLVFCPHAGGNFGVANVAEHLRDSLRMDVRTYSGKLSPDVKTETSRRFKDDKFSLLVATKAFGMGIDKPNVRYTVHYGLPPSLEAFYQEAGRAGRDRGAAHCVVLASVDDPGRAEKLLDTGTPVEGVAGLMATLRNWDNDDDITRAMYFHTQGYRGVDAETQQIRQLLPEIGDLGVQGTVVLTYVSESKDGKARKRGGKVRPNLRAVERTLHRLMILGVVADYTVDYQNMRVQVERATTSVADLRAKLGSYIGSYSQARADAALEDLPPISDALVSSVAATYIEVLTRFIYDTIELARRTAMREVWRWSELGRDDSKLRQRLLDYLQESEFSRDVQRILREQEFDMSAWTSAIDNVRSKRDLEEFDAALARSAEDYPDHPALIAARAVCAAAGASTAEAVTTYIGQVKHFMANRYRTALPSGGIERWLLDELRRRKTQGVAWRQVVPLLVADDDGHLCEWVLAEDFPAGAKEATAPRLLELLVSDQRRFNDRHLTLEVPRD